MATAKYVSLPKGGGGGGGRVGGFLVYLHLLKSTEPKGLKWM